MFRGLILLSFLIVFSLAGCYSTRPSDGGGQHADFAPPRVLNPEDVLVPPTYSVTAVAEGFTFPTGVVVDEEDVIYVLEAGYSYGEVFDTAKLLRIEADGTRTLIASSNNPPWTGVSYSEGVFYISEGGVPGRILTVTKDGVVTTLVDNLPGLVDHHTNRPVRGSDGYVYFTQGTATNSGVVGVDNFEFGWLARRPEMHDIPARDIVLTGQNFESPNPLTADEEDRVVTGAFVPFGTSTQPDQVIPGALPCTGCVMRVPATGGAIELVSWGLRNPFGLAFAPDGRLFTTENSFDRRGSRPVIGAPDHLYLVTNGAWYGWPDFAAGQPLTDARFAEDGNPQPQFLMKQHPGVPPQPVAQLGAHSASNGLDFSRSELFGHVGQAFIAQFDDMADNVDKVLHPVGFKVVRVDVNSGVVEDFAVNRGERNGPASKLGHGGLERPCDVRFNNDGTVLYVLDFGVLLMPDKPTPHKGTGVLWRISRTH